MNDGKHTRQNNHHGSIGGTRRPRRGGSKQQLPLMAANIAQVCWCGEQHDNSNPDPTLWRAGTHPWDVMNDG
jgi:hypothetical protein